ncbi:DNA-binding response regulator, NarL/FixJ family, contains REC and HTH domains [Clostridium collagenovorans DSM 3089]|uniref:Stage 0 sporulation protein A homolog n=1 Tax=Clostridium collagenovorans DSM 3089 TaxID=1121306 RepID=A0A1M5YAH4_9CLOT|nr:response regulator transcription factor [Clostridium collagenovorans]SHI08966.1 DNA-binding response regulator, NarL/FixJ family, contains REC and HTH domains [Clostridium collagenovorans DSM 3089]
MNTLILSDSFIVKDSLRNLLESNFNMDNIEMASKIKDLSTEILTNMNLLIVDLNDNDNDLSYINKLKETFRNLKIIIFDFFKGQSNLLNLFNINIDAYVLNPTDKIEFIYIIRKVLDGKKYFSSEILNTILQSNLKESSSAKITTREFEVLNCLSKGLSNKDIAKSLYISEYTVKKHISNMLYKLELKSRHSLVIFALENNLFKA